MDLAARLLIVEILLTEFAVLVEALDPYDRDFPEILRKAKSVEAKMNRFYIKWDNPPEMLEHIQGINKIIKRLEQKQNNHVTDL